MSELFRSCMRLMEGRQKKLILPMILSLIDSLLNSAQLLVLLEVVADLIQNTLNDTKLLRCTLILALIFLGRMIAQSVSFTLAQCGGSITTYKLRLRLANHLRRLSLGFFQTSSLGELTGILINDVNDFNAIITHCLCDFFKVLSFLLLSLAAAYWIAWIYGLSLTLIFALCTPLLFLSGRKAKQNAGLLKKANSALASRMIEYVEGMKTFRLYQRIGEGFARLYYALTEMKRSSIRFELESMPYSLGFSLISALILPLTIVLGAFLLQNAQIDAARFLLMLFLSASLCSLLSILRSLYPQLQSLERSCSKLNGLLDVQPLSFEQTDAVFENYDISFSHVSFGYTSARTVLHDLSFTAKQGTLTALVGPSGSGKTTIVSLLARFWDPDQGDITIGSQPIQKIELDALCEKIAVVFQDVYLLNDTVLNNIRLAKPAASKNEVIKAAKAACCHDFIMKLENGYDTIIQEGGKNLSGGERQRIAIARALLKDAPIVLLDETTSSLDADNEMQIQQAFSELMKNKTVLVIAHRLKTIRQADQIIVLQNGRILQRGTHRQLMEEKGWYADMIKVQQEAKRWKVQKE